MKSNLKASGIYVISNIVNGKRYIGSAVNLRKRKAQHKLNLRKGTHKNVILQNAWNKHGSDNFKFSVIEYCSKDMLLKREQQYLDEKSDYNICPIAGNTLGMKHTRESRKKISEAKKYLTDESRARMSAAHKGKQMGKENPNFGRKHTPEELEKMRVASLGRTTFLGKKHTEKSKKKMSDFRMGIKLSDKTRAKMSASHIGMKLSLKARKKIGAALRGRKFSDETIFKMSIAAKNRKRVPCSETTKAKISAALILKNEQTRIGSKRPPTPGGGGDETS